MTDSITFEPLPKPFVRMLTDPPARCEGCYVVAERLVANRRLEIAADLVLEQRHGTSLTEQERRLIRDGFLEQVERRYRGEREAASV